jgi:hypothetical protein
VAQESLIGWVRKTMQALLNKVIAALAVTPTCPGCKGVIPSDDVNVVKDIAYCRVCNLSHELSGLMAGVEIDTNLDVSRPPAGTWFRREGIVTVTGASHRSLGQALGLLFFCLFWNGIVSVFVLLAAASTLRHMGVVLPASFPAPTSKGAFLPVGMTIFLWIFLTPFIAIGLAMIAAFLSSLVGQTELRVQGGDAALFTGFGPVGLRKHFKVSDVKSVRIEDKRWRDSDGDSRRNTHIIIEKQDGKPLKFGSMLSEERRKFLAGAVRKTLVA